MKNKILVGILINLVFILAITSVFASADLIEEDIGEYNYIGTDERNWTPDLSEKNVSYPIYYLHYNNSEGERIQIQIIEFGNDNFGKDYLTTWITQKIKEGGNQVLFFSDNYMFKHTRYGEGLIWRHKNIFIHISFTNYSNLPEKIIETYLDLYPSDCSEVECPNLDKPIEERIYEKFFLGYNQYTSGLYFKYEGFDVKCKNIEKFGKEDLKKYPDLNYSQFKEKIKEYLKDSMYFNEEELEGLYEECMDKEEINIQKIPLEGFLKDCYDKVSPQLIEEIETKDEEIKAGEEKEEDRIIKKSEEGLFTKIINFFKVLFGFERVEEKENILIREEKLDSRSLKLCDNINLIITENNEYFEELKEENPEIINQIIDFIAQKESERSIGMPFPELLKEVDE